MLNVRNRQEIGEGHEENSMVVVLGFSFIHEGFSCFWYS